MPIEDRDHVISVEEAIARIIDGETVHAFSNPAVNLLVGADWDRSDVENAIRKFGGAWLTGEQAKSMRHGIAVEVEGRVYFFETKETDVTGASCDATSSV